MKNSLTQTAIIVGLLTIGFIKPVNAQPPLFNFTLTVKEVSEPHVFLGRDKKSFAPTGKNTFNINGRQSDYFFSVQHQYEGKSKEAICEISGVPMQVIATIDPRKEGRDACTTEEFGRG